MPGAKRLVAHLHANGIPIAIATASARTAFEVKTGHLKETFSLFDGRIVCATDPQMAGRESKPAPDIFIEAAKLLGFDLPRDGAKGLVFEDAVLGFQAGAAANLNGEHDVRTGGGIALTSLKWFGSQMKSWRGWRAQLIHFLAASVASRRSRTLFSRTTDYRLSHSERVIASCWCSNFKEVFDR